MQRAPFRYSANELDMTANGTGAVVIEYALLFALGFLAATLAGLLVAPAIQRRIVAYTEKRMKATMPLSPQEVRAQTDMARAAFAVENARVSQTLRRERDKNTRLAVQNEALKRDAGKLAADLADLRAHIEDMNVDAGDLRSNIRHEEQRFGNLKAELEAAGREILQKKREIEILNANRDLVQTEFNDTKITLAARETEIENLTSRLQTLRHEREKLLEGLRLAQTDVKDAGARLSREEGRARQLEAKLQREINQSAAKDTAIERRNAEITRLREKVKPGTSDTKATVRVLRAPLPKSLLAAPPETPLIEYANGESVSPQTNGVDLMSLETDVRDLSADIGRRLSEPATPQGDAALREDIADVAARMIVLTEAREGAASPIRSLLDQAGPSADGNRISLAERAKDLLPPRK